MVVQDKIIREGDWLSLNGSTGEVISGIQPLSPPALSGDLGTFMSWVDGIRQIKVTYFPDSLRLFNWLQTIFLNTVLLITRD